MKHFKVIYRNEWGEPEVEVAVIASDSSTAIALARDNLVEEERYFLEDEVKQYSVEAEEIEGPVLLTCWPMQGA
jgi:hypothetical protein